MGDSFNWPEHGPVRPPPHPLFTAQFLLVSPQATSECVSPVLVVTRILSCFVLVPCRSGHGHVAVVGVPAEPLIIIENGKIREIRNTGLCLHTMLNGAWEMIDKSKSDQCHRN